MVYNNISLIVGFTVTGTELEHLMENSDFNENLDYGLRVHRYPCCSDINDKFFIIGKKVKTWVRKCSTCKQCTEYSCCDNCIGQTCYGYYDVNKILNQVVDCPIENVCMYCWKDNKKSITKECEDCGHIPNWNMRFNWKQDNLFEDKPLVKNINKFMQDSNIKSNVKIYYMLDDCLSCT